MRELFEWVRFQKWAQEAWTKNVRLTIADQKEETKRKIAIRLAPVHLDVTH